MQCFFPQNVIQQIQTPIFILNAAYDSWQVQTLPKLINMIQLDFQFRNYRNKQTYFSFSNIYI